MEKAMDLEQRTLTVVAELIQGKELAEHLRKHFNSISSPETRQFFVEKILSSYDKALSMLNWDASCAVEIKPAISALESPHCYANISPRSDVSDQDCKDHRDVYKKRKTESRWTKQVKICSGTGLEGPLGDGYSWRKYGQKDILGANFPRGYYRCTHRNSQGCLATKQVQKSDQDPTIYEVTYRGRHTCFQASHLAATSSSTSLKNAKTKQDSYSCGAEQPEQKPKPLKDLSFNFAGVKSQDLDIMEDIFPLFSFPDSSKGNENEENDILGSLSPALISSSTSDSSYFALSSYHMNNSEIEARTLESDSTQNSASNSPITYWDISLDDIDFDTNFPLENSSIFA